MTDDASWFAEAGNGRAAGEPRTRADTGHTSTWAERFRGAILGGAVGDALGAGVRHRTTLDIQRHFGPRGVRDYLPIFGVSGACTELTQLTVFTLEALLRAKAANRDATEWLPTPVIRTNHLRWLYTQGVPWEYAMSAYLQTHPQPSGWMLERPELFSTRNPAGGALAALGKLAMQPPTDTPYDPHGPVAGPGFTDCVVWAAPTMVWETSGEIVFAAGAEVAKMLTDDRDVQAAAGLHAEVLGRLIRGENELWNAVSDARSMQSPAGGVRRAVHGAMFLARDGRNLEPEELDAEFDTDREPGALGIALTAVAATDNFADAVSVAVNQSADSSVAGALAGQLAGALYGPQGIPSRWLQELELHDIIETLCADVAEAFAPPPPPPPLPKWAQRYVSDHGQSFSGPLELTPPPVVESATMDGSVDEFPELGSSSRSVAEDLSSSFPEHTAQFVPEESPRFVPEDTPRFVSKDTVPESFVVADATLEVSFADPEPGNVVPEPLSSEITLVLDLNRVGDGFPLTEHANSFLEPMESLPPDATLPGPVPLDDEPEPAEVAPQPAVEWEVAETPEAIGEEPSDFSASVDGTADDEPAIEIGFPADTDMSSGGEVKAVDSGGGHALVEGADRFPPSLTERVLGCFLGGALGDALGSDLEFLSAEQIAETVGPDGPRGLREAYGVHGAITDDTQMTLFTAEGLIRGSTARRTYGVDDPLPEIQLAYQRWLHTQGVDWEAAAGVFHADHPRPDGWLIGVNELFSIRAPGKTVFRALIAFGEGEPAGSLTRRINNSKGCGGVMRSAPMALYSTDPAVVFELAARAAALTHSHPSGYLSAGALAVIVQQALLGQDLDDGVWLALQVLETWEGHEETSMILKVAVDLASQGVPGPERIAEVLGGGWVGEEALAIAVCAALVGGEDVELALRVAVHHSGDSDSTGAVCGNIVGALVGIGGLPMDWLAELELREVIEQVALDCVAEFGVGEFFPAESAHAQPDDEDWSSRYPLRPLRPQDSDPPQTEPPSAAESPGVVPPPENPDPEGDAEDAIRDEPEPPSPSPEPEEPAELAAFPAKPPPPSTSFADGTLEAFWPPRSTRVSEEEFFRTAPPAPRPAPRRINGVVNYHED